MADYSVANISSLHALSSMLNPKEDSSDDEDKPDTHLPSMTPGSIGPPKKSETKATPYSKKSDSKDIWDEDEVPETTSFEDTDDGRPQPEYDITYKQSVSSEDMFLGTTGKNPSSACCEYLVVKITLPDTKMQDVDLQVKEHILDCRTSKFKLVLPLPHPVNPDGGSAKWDGQKHILAVTLAMKREYDFLNFQG